MFNKIWKEQISRTKGKATIWKPKEKMKPDVKDEEDKCCEEAKKYLHYFLMQHGESPFGILDLTCKEFREKVEQNSRDRSLEENGKIAFQSVDLFWQDCEEEFVEAELWHTKENWIWGKAPREDAWDKV